MQKRVIVSFEHAPAWVRQILDASSCLDGFDFPGFDRRAFGRTHVALSGAIFALAESADVDRVDCFDSNRDSKTRTRNGVRDSCRSSLASASQRPKSAIENSDPVFCGLDSVRDFCGERRVPSIVRAVAHSVGARCDDRYLRSIDRITDLSGLCPDEHKKARGRASEVLDTEYD
jgi:hypothetical protein